MSEDRYPECERCAFRDDEDMICDICDDADQFEPYQHDDFDEDSASSTVIPILQAA